MTGSVTREHDERMLRVLRLLVEAFRIQREFFQPALIRLQAHAITERLIEKGQEIETELDAWQAALDADQERP